jgi:hypothetical protein
MASLAPTQGSFAPTAFSPSGFFTGSLAPSFAPAPRIVPTMAPSSTKDPLSMNQLNTLIDKIDFEILALKRIPETPTLLATISRLAVLRQDLTEIRIKITATPPEMTLANVGISSQDADNFLASLGRASASSTYPSLLQSKGFTSSPSGTNASLLGNLSNMLENQDLQKVFEGIQFIKWKFEVDYDPKLHEKFFLLDRLENLEKRILSYSSAGTPVPSEVRELAKKELEFINLQIKSSTTAPTAKPVESYAGIGENTRIPTAISNKDPRVYDVYVRPGSLMNDEQIKNRANVSYFSDQVGQPDYKKRVEFLCNQIQSAGLGNPTNFGCISDPKSVSAEYSWRGNWNMVCSRVGDTWGAWYPEMFGCPKPNPDDRYDGTLL